jgi:malonate-semialdehyde dehydrogenase (acetylating)/methylmalonate-semialdehyde dehydrogenase
MKCYQEEIFGPVLVCLNVDTLDDAIELINSNKYGNGVAVFTNSGASATRFQQNIEAGQVGINTPIPGTFSVKDCSKNGFSDADRDLAVPLPMFSFTGNKGSIAGQSGHYFYGKSGLNFYTQLKTVTAYVFLFPFAELFLSQIYEH